jgi:hypothetical protein
VTTLRRLALWACASALVVVALAACGSSSSSTKSTSSSSSSAAASASGSSASRTKLTACLKQHGVTLPSHAGGYHGGGGYGGGGGTPPAGANGSHKFKPGSGHGGFFGGAQGKKMQAALKACGANFKGRGGFAGRFRPSTTELAKFTACVASRGYKLPKANTSGKGSIFPKSIETNKKFEAASKACASDLRPAGAGGAAGSGGSGGSA